MPLRIGKRAGETLRSAGEISTVGLAFVLALVLGAWFGRVVDRWLGTTPWFFIVFFFLGLAAGILNVYRTVSHAFMPTGNQDEQPAPGAAGQPGKAPTPALNKPFDVDDQSDPGPDSGNR
jgi:F0F1-type ATP synthase assembly protein I